jgi:Ca-activated chloride channel homolog
MRQRNQILACTGFLALVVAVGFGASRAARAADFGKLSGKVQEASSSKPLSGATITVGTKGPAATSGPDGSYVLDKVPAGKQTVSCTLAGYKPQKRTVNIAPGAELKLVFSLTVMAEPVPEEAAPEPKAKSEAKKESAAKSMDMEARPSAPPPPSSQPSPSRAKAAMGAPPPAPVATPVADDRKADLSAGGEEYQEIRDNPFMMAAAEPVSTFSIDVDTASYANARRFLTSSSLPPKDAVRIEEFVNYFPYEYAAPTGPDPFSINAEISTCPWAKGHRLVLIGLQGKKVDTAQLPPTNLVFLIDSSGSMSDPNKLPLLVAAFKLLVGQMRAKDRVAITVYAGSAGLVLPSTPGDQKEKIMAALESLGAGGSTAGAAGIELAYKVAKENLIQGGNNRVILATDGDFNVGMSNDAELEKLIEAKRNQGIFLTVLGFGMGNYKDTKMKKLADKGNGNYAYIDTLSEARKVLITQMGGTLLTIAKDVKIQVEFNPAKVKAYRLLGYESRIMAKEDFDNDKKDAGELGAGHTVTAFYEVIPAGSDEKVPGVDPAKVKTTTAKLEVVQPNDLLAVKFRYKKPAGSESTLLTHPLADGETAIDKTSETFKFASAVVEMGLLLRDSPYKASASFSGLIKRAASALGKDEFGYRKEFVSLAEKAAALQPK